MDWCAPAPQGSQVTNYTCFARAVGGSLIYTVFGSVNQREEELAYSEEAKGWLT